MGSYGIGVSRLVAAIIQANHDENGIIWPTAVAPYSVGLLNLDPSNESVTRKSEDLYNGLRENGVDVLYDDRANVQARTKFTDMDLRGMPYQIRVGYKNYDKSSCEVKDRRTGNVSTMSQQSLIDQLKV